MIESSGVASSMSREQLHLELGPLGAVFLDEVGLRQRLLHVRGEGQAVARRARREADGVELPPRLVHVLAQVGFRVGGGVGRDHVEAARQVLGGPARADDPGADDGDSVDGFVEGHDSVLLLGDFNVCDAREVALGSLLFVRGRSFQRVRVLAVEHELTSLVMHRRPRGYDARVSLRCQLDDFELGIDRVPRMHLLQESDTRRS